MDLPSSRVVMIGKPGCHLCDDARAVIERVVARYAEEIPVTFVDGRQHDYWRVDEGRLRAALRA